MLQKNALLFHDFQLIIVLLLICDACTSWITRFISLKLCEMFDLWFCLIFMKVYIFVQQKVLTLWLYNIIIPFKIKVIEKPLTVLLLDLWFLSCKKKFEKSVISEWVGALKILTWRRTFKLRKSKFWLLHFFSIVIVSKHLTFLYWIIYLFLLITYLFI